MGIYLLIPTLVVILVSVLVVRAGAVALRLTGLDQKTANFQALSAFTRAGFTTAESEKVVSNPQRRAIVTWLIILGNAGIVAVIVTGTSSLTSSSTSKMGAQFAILVVGVYIIYRLVRHTGLTARWERWIENRFLKGRFFSRIVVEHLLHLAEGYGTARAFITDRSALAGGTMGGLPSLAGGLTVVGIERKGEWIPNPGPDERIDDGDALIVFGKLREIDDFFKRNTTGRD
jgi:hypothetical protein